MCNSVAQLAIVSLIKWIADRYPLKIDKLLLEAGYVPNRDWADLVVTENGHVPDGPI